MTLLYHQFIKRGGLEGYLYEFARQLQQRDYPLTLIGSHIDDRFRALATKVHRIWPPPFSSGLMLARFAQRSAALLPKLADGPVLGFGRTYKQDIHRAGGGCHKVYSRLLPPAKQRRWKNQLELRLEHQLYTGGQTPRFVVNATRVKEELQSEYHVSADRIHVIHTGVDTNYYTPGSKADARQQLHAPAAPLLLFVSLDHRRKGLDPLLQALAQIPEAHLWIVGAPLDAAWQSRIHQLGLTSRVTSHGRQQDLRPFYQAADLFVHPTKYDACANTVLQSLACGLPGIISTHDGARDFITQSQNGYLLQDPTNVEELTHLIQTGLAQHQRLAPATRPTVLPLTWQRHVAQWLTLLDQS
jgi:UDP-glucose:(heptosyl)LPS alpha-1,3-glucosyltransferase